MAVSFIIPALFINAITGSVSLSPQNTLIQTTEGLVQGITRDGILQFINIPFAKPPINDLRFEPPQTLDKRDEKDILDATQTLDSLNNMCPQGTGGIEGLSGDEDCLYLNIFAPSDKKKRTKLPVMLWISGGSFIIGGGSLFLYDPTNWLNNPKANDVIIVTVNYRLGALGFLYDNTFGTGIEGNYGYLDLIKATEWVYNNIESFGGDQDNIITIGQSAGAYLAMLQLLYNPEYVKGSILQSAPYQIPLRDPVTWYNTFETFTGLVRCTDPLTIATCLKNVSVEDILAAQAATIPDLQPAYSVYGAPYPGNDWTWWFVQWSPTALTDIIPNQIIFEFEDGDIDTAPFIIGTVRDEQYFTFSNDLIGLDYDSFVGSLAFLIDGVNVYDGEQVLPRTAPVTFSILRYYKLLSADKSLTGDYQNDLLEIMTDFWYCSNRYVLKNIEDTTNFYYYNFDYMNSQTNMILQSVLGYQGCVDKVCHAVDLLYEWLAPALQPNFDEETIALGDIIQQLFTDYANDFEISGKIWPEYTNKKGKDNFIRILGADDLVIESTFTSETRSNTNTISQQNDLCDFWDSVGYLHGSERSLNDYDNTQIF